MQLFDLPVPGVRPESIGFSPDGRFLGAWAFGRVFAVETRTGRVRTLRNEPDWIGYGTPGVGFTPDGSGLVTLHYLRRDDGEKYAAVRVYDVESGAVRRAWEEKNFEAMEATADGRLVYAGLPFGTRAVEIAPWDPVTGEKKAAFARHGGFLRQLAVSADGKWVAGSDSNVIRVWNLGAGKPPTRATRQFRSGRYAWIQTVALSPNGSHVAAAGHGIEVWDVATGGHVQVEATGASRGRQIAFHPSRPVLAYARNAGGEVVFWDAAGGAEVKRYAWGLDRPEAVAFSPDGLRCAAAGTGQVVVWDVDG